MILNKLKDEDLTTAELAAMMLPSMANHTGNVHGGNIMKMMDSAAGCVAMKYSGGDAVTARVDELQFLYPVLVGQMLTCKARIAFVGNSTMDVLVTVEVTELAQRQKYIALTGIFTMVAMDYNGRPVKVAALEEPTDSEELSLYNHCKRRYQERKKQKKQ